MTRFDSTTSNVPSANFIAVASPLSTSTFSFTPSISALREVRSRVLSERSTVLHTSTPVAFSGVQLLRRPDQQQACSRPYVQHALIPAPVHHPEHFVAVSKLHKFRIHHHQHATRDAPDRRA